AESSQVVLQRSPDTLLRLRFRRNRRRVVDLRRQLRVLHHLREQQRPRARHDLADRVAPTSQRQPPSLAQLVGELVERRADLWPDPCRGGKGGGGGEVTGGR